MRVGIAMNRSTRTAEEGKLYSTEAISFCENVGFLVGIEGAEPVIPDSGDLILGGEMRAASFQKIDSREIDSETRLDMKEGCAFKLLLTSPAIFSQGWLPDNIVASEGKLMLKHVDFQAKLVCAAIKGNEIVSGWDVAGGKPKDAQRAVPAGSVYWFRDFEGSAEALQNYCMGELHGEKLDQQRRAEGFNRGLAAVFES